MPCGRGRRRRSHLSPSSVRYDRIRGRRLEHVIAPTGTNYLLGQPPKQRSDAIDCGRRAQESAVSNGFRRHAVAVAIRLAEPEPPVQRDRRRVALLDLEIRDLRLATRRAARERARSRAPSAGAPDPRRGRTDRPDRRPPTAIPTAASSSRRAKVARPASRGNTVPAWASTSRSGSHRAHAASHSGVA